MDKSSSVVWLGNFENAKVRHSLLLRLVGQGVNQAPPEGTTARYAQPNDCDLIRDTILLFDEALDQLDKDEDYQTRQIIDHLALDVLNRIRECAKKLASGGPRAV